MQEQLRARIKQLQEQQQHGQKMLENINREVLMIQGALNEAVSMLNQLVAQEKKVAADFAAAKAEKEALKQAKKTKQKTAKTKTPTTQENAASNTTPEDQDLAA